ncbi:MAG: hypothetical protein ED859_09755 [Desulfuromonadales bacterium]|nr:MAG: hypothetical protein ED859_09755 [Desulfuromonadales bacterium]
MQSLFLGAFYCESTDRLTRAFFQGKYLDRNGQIVGSFGLTEICFYSNIQYFAGVHHLHDHE